MYRLYGVPDRLRVEHPDCAHDFPDEMRQIAYRLIVLGYFTPTIDANVYEGAEPQVSDEELLRRSREGGGRSLAEILNDLEKRA